MRLDAQRRGAADTAALRPLGRAARRRRRLHRRQHAADLPHLFDRVGTVDTIDRIPDLHRPGLIELNADDPPFGRGELPQVGRHAMAVGLRSEQVSVDPPRQGQAGSQPSEETNRYPHASHNITTERFRGGRREAGGFRSVVGEFHRARVFVLVLVLATRPSPLEPPPPSSPSPFFPCSCSCSSSYSRLVTRHSSPRPQPHHHPSSRARARARPRLLVPRRSRLALRIRLTATNHCCTDRAGGTRRLPLLDRILNILGRQVAHVPHDPAARGGTVRGRGLA